MSSEEMSDGGRMQSHGGSEPPVPPYVDVEPAGSTYMPPNRAPSYPPASYPAANYPAQPYGYAAGPPKNPAVSLVASFFIPGLGSMINGDVGKGIGILIGWFISLFLIVFVIGIFGVIGFWVFGLVDAYQGAKIWNARRGIIT